MKEILLKTAINLCRSQAQFTQRQVALAGLAIGISTIIGMPSVRAAEEKARSADSFVDSIGVNTHLFYQSSVYYQRYDDLIEPKLLKLGVRHIRDGGTTGVSAYIDRLKKLAAKGIRSTLVFDPNLNKPQDAVPMIKQLGGNVVEAVQGPNEPELNLGSDWVSETRNYQQQLYQAIKGDGATSGIAVYGPAISEGPAHDALGEICSSVDAGTLNEYYAGHHPEISGWGSDGYGSTSWKVKLSKRTCSSKPGIITETGYDNTMSSSSPNRGIPEEISAKYLPRLFLQHFNAGIPRTFSYELINVYHNPDDWDKNFGLLRNDGSEKPAFAALQNLIGLLEDPGSSFTPGTLDYVLSGNTTNVSTTLLQKRDGKFYLILWHEVPSYDPSAKKKVSVSSQKVQLTLNTEIAKATIYQPTNSANWVKQESNPKTIDLDVPDHPLVIELEPN